MCGCLGYTPAPSWYSHLAASPGCSPRPGGSSARASSICSAWPTAALADHIAVRDDLGMMTQLGFIPPRVATAIRLLRMHVSGGARRSVREAILRGDRAARQAATVTTA